MLESVERERGKRHTGDIWGKSGSVVQAFFTCSLTNRLGGPWKGTSVDTLACTDQVGNKWVLGSVNPQLTNPHGINKSEGGVHSVRPLLRVFFILIVHEAVFGPVQIRQLLKSRPPTLQVVIIQVRFGRDGLEGTQRPRQRSSALVSVDLNGVVGRCRRVAVGLRNPRFDEVVNVHAVSSMAAAGPQGELELWFDVLSRQETVGTVWVLGEYKERSSQINPHDALSKQVFQHQQGNGSLK